MLTSCAFRTSACVVQMTRRCWNGLLTKGGCWSPTMLLLCHDAAYQRVSEGLPMPGVFAVPWSAPLGQVIEDLLLLAEASLPGEWEGQIIYLPL